MESLILTIVFGILIIFITLLQIQINSLTRSLKSGFDDVELQMEHLGAWIDHVELQNEKL